MKRKRFINGKIFTSDGTRQDASAMIVEDGVIRWIGREEEMPEPGGETAECGTEDGAADCGSEGEAADCETVDLRGARVLPGILDGHMHPPILAAASKKIACVPPEIHSIEELLKEIKRRRQEQGPGKWIQGWGYDEGKLAEHRAPTRRELDEAAPDAPVMLMRTCVHIAALNSEALRLAGIDRNTPNPPGGEIERDENGEPTGILKESARELAMAAAPVPDPEETADGLVALGKKLLAHGVTGIADAMGRYRPVDSYGLFLRAREKGMKQRVAVYYQWHQTEELQKEGALDAEWKARQDRTLPVYTAGIKILGDGSISGRTAWMERPYLDDNGNSGMVTTTAEELSAAADFAQEHGLQLEVHAMGTRTIDLVVNTLKDRPKWTEHFPHIRVEHVTLPSRQAMKDAADTGIAFASQPIFLFCEIETYLRYLGAEPLKETYPYADMLAEGVKLSFASDAPGTSWADPSNPFIGMQFAVTRTAYDGTDCGRDQSIDVASAVELYTRESAEILGMPQAGRLKEGYRADFIVLDRDILDIPPEQIGETNVEFTYIDGECVYTR